MLSPQGLFLKEEYPYLSDERIQSILADQEKAPVYGWAHERLITTTEAAMIRLQVIRCMEAALSPIWLTEEPFRVVGLLVPPVLRDRTEVVLEVEKADGCRFRVYEYPAVTPTNFWKEKLGVPTYKAGFRGSCFIIEQVAYGWKYMREMES